MAQLGRVQVKIVREFQAGDGDGDPIEIGDQES